MTTVVLTSGGFDPLHIGHVRLFNEARLLGDHLLVLVNCDEWLLRKKKYVFMEEADRAQIVGSLRSVDTVVVYSSINDHMADAILMYRPAIFAKGGDRIEGNIPQEEVDACAKVGCRIVYGVGGGKMRSSSTLVRNAIQ